MDYIYRSSMSRLTAPPFMGLIYSSGLLCLAIYVINFSLPYVLLFQSSYFGFFSISYPDVKLLGVDILEFRPYRNWYNCRGEPVPSTGSIGGFCHHVSIILCKMTRTLRTGTTLQCISLNLPFALYSLEQVNDWIL